jgi:hypothetical protein
MMTPMPAIPDSTKTSLAQRLRAHAKDTCPQLTTIHVRYRASFAYIDGELTDGDIQPLMRLRYGGSAHRWGLAIHLASNNSYENQPWFTGGPEEALDIVCDLYVTSTDH